MKPAGLVLAGGLGSRMGGDVPKPDLPVGGRTSLSHAIDCLSPFCDPVLVGTGRDGAGARSGLSVVRDRRAARLGPLAGLEAAFLALRERGAAATHLVCVPGDTPFLPRDLVSRLGLGDLPRVARHRGRLHPTVAAWPLEALRAITAELDDPGGERSLMWLLRSLDFAPADFPPDAAAPDGDPFFNLNTPDDLEKARRHLG